MDYEGNARDITDAAKEAGIAADVVIDVAVGTRSGIPAGEQAVALAQLIDKLPNLKLRGMLSTTAAPSTSGVPERASPARSAIEPNARDVRAR